MCFMPWVKLNGVVARFWTYATPSHSDWMLQTVAVVNATDSLVKEDSIRVVSTNRHKVSCGQ